MNPRAELRDMLKRIMGATVPHLKVPEQLKYLAKRISAESGLDVGAGTIKDWLYALDDDARRVDSRHMDWARAKDRQYGVANDNAPSRAGGWSPCSAEAVIWEVAA
jgi:AAA+ superfamily predicted ATPase